MVVFDDITAELQSEAALEEARALVQEQRDQLAHASRLTTMGEMAAGFAHEVNQPLTAITNYARVSKRMMAKEEPDLGLLGETLDKIEAQSHRASEIIRRIRRFMKSRPRARKSSRYRRCWKILASLPKWICAITRAALICQSRMICLT